MGQSPLLFHGGNVLIDPSGRYPQLIRCHFVCSKMREPFEYFFLSRGELIEERFGLGACQISLERIQRLRRVRSAVVWIGRLGRSVVHIADLAKNVETKKAEA